MLFFSTSAVFVRLAAPISPYEITFLRMVVAAATSAFAIVLTGVSNTGRFPREGRFAFYGLIAALHFLLFVTSLSFTSIAHSLSITYTAPVFIALGSWLWLHERLTPLQVAGVLVVVIGVGILAGFEPRLDRRMLLGDGLALLSAICFAIYSLAGRHERERYRLLPYTTTVYSLAALWLLPAFVVGFAGFGRPASIGGGWSVYSVRTVLAVLGAGILPLGIGHTLYNASVRRIPATFSNLIATQEVTGGVILGVLLLSEIPSITTVAGALVTLLGIGLVLIPGRQSQGRSSIEPQPV
ncbi:MAG: DMT family transporter [Chloroflexota bacterium]|nr:DMT family transporter [Chloroflexota bacterium]